jgi:hypothetical protein
VIRDRAVRKVEGELAAAKADTSAPNWVGPDIAVPKAELPSVLVMVQDALEVPLTIWFATNEVHEALVMLPPWAIIPQQDSPANAKILGNDK